MEAFLPYILKVTICLTLFYISVKAFLSNDTFFRFNRNILLIGSIICFILPFINIRLTETSILQTTLIQFEEAIMYQPAAAEGSEAASRQQATANQNTGSGSIHWTTVAFFIYIAGFIINLIILLRSYFSMINIIRKGRKYPYQEYTLVLVDTEIAPFSWKDYIVMTEEDFHNHSEEIITHEIAHLNHRHSLDIILIELIVLLQWFNPAVWLLKRELKDIHEYQADMSVLKSGIDATKYQLLLVKKAVGASSYTLANSFNHSKIKKRITMMLKEKSNKWARLKLLLLLPLGVLSVYAFARPEAKQLSESLSVSEVTKLSGKNDSNRVVILLPDTLPKNQIMRWDKEKDEEYRKRRGETSVGHFKTMYIMKGSTPQNADTYVTVHPVSYNKKGDGNDKNYIRIYYYVIDGKKYMPNKFLNICKNGKVFFQKDNIKPEDGKITEVYGITDNGAKTPVFYMAIPEN